MPTFNLGRRIKIGRRATFGTAAVDVSLKSIFVFANSICDFEKYFLFWSFFALSRSIILHLVLSYEEFVAGQVQKSRDTLRCMVEETTKLKKDEDAVENSSRLVALDHLLLAASAHLSIYLKDDEAARKVSAPRLGLLSRVSCMSGLQYRVHYAKWKVHVGRKCELPPRARPR